MTPALTEPASVVLVPGTEVAQARPQTLPDLINLIF